MGVAYKNLSVKSDYFRHVRADLDLILNAILNVSLTHPWWF